MAQEVLCKKLDGSLDQPDKVESARERLTKLFDAPLPDDAMEANKPGRKERGLIQESGGKGRGGAGLKIPQSPVVFLCLLCIASFIFPPSWVHGQDRGLYLCLQYSGHLVASCRYCVLNGCCELHVCQAGT
jgi:hypothetical protein